MIRFATCALLLSCEGAGVAPPEEPGQISQALTVTASWDSALRAPRCGGAASACSSGSLLTGRASLGPEVNAPNTLLGSCADGTAGRFHSDESLDAVTVTATGGGDFAPLAQVRVDATVWAYAAYTSDKLDVFYASNASAPSWQ